MIQPLHSLTIYLFNKTFEKPSDDNNTSSDTIGEKLQHLHHSLFFRSKNDSTLKVCAKHLYTTAFLSGLTIIGLVETVVRTSLFLMVKTFQFFVPKESTHELNFNILIPLLTHVRFSIEGTMQAASSIVTQFQDSHSHQKTMKKIINCTLNNYYARNFAALHFNGFDSSAISRNLA